MAWILLLISSNLSAQKIAVKAKTTFVFSSKYSYMYATVLIGNKHIEIHADEHNSTDTKYASPVFYTDTAVIINILRSAGNVKLEQFEIPTVKINSVHNLNRREECDMPTIIPQSEWRAGLPLPIKGRNATPTKHCIVHHSAANSGDTNYTQLVRSIYTYHTQGNGWDDIGYNYIITANGAVYAGREPDSAGIEQDNVQGAHFCGKNQYTMGVCLVGDLETNEPTDTQVNALIALLKWKFKKDNLNPYLSIPHPTPADPKLIQLAGHRDGCNTACPGKNMYTLIPDVRYEVVKCTPFASLSTLRQSAISIENIGLGEWIINHANKTLWSIYDLSGKIVKTGKGSTIQWNKPGLYFITANINAMIVSKLIYNP